MDYEKAYKEGLNKLQEGLNKLQEGLNKFQEALSQTDGHEISGITRRCIEEIFPDELVESEDERDERIRKELIEHCKNLVPGSEYKKHQSWVAWLEKQGEQAGLAKETLTSCALSFIKYLDTHRYEGKMCVSNGECEDIEDAFHNAMWDKLHRYYCKYIEKQGEKPNDEQEPTVLIEPEFKAGDWIVVENMVGQISDIREDCYVGLDTKGWTFALSRPAGNSNAHLWTIEDVKEGDVITIGDEYFLFKKKKDNAPTVYISHCFCDSAGTFRVTNESDCGEFLSMENGIKACPATKEQRKFLFAKMKEAGYEWDNQNKSLLKIKE